MSQAKLVGPEGQPLAERLAQRLRAHIERGTYKSGDRLPTEQELAEEYQVSRDTVRRAINKLTQEGLLAAQRGKGRYVRSYKPLEWWPGTFEHSKKRRDTAPNAAQDAWASDVAAQGRTPAQSIDVAIIAPPPPIAERLGLTASGDMVVVRRRLRFVDDIPFQTADSYYPEHVARGTPIMEAGDITIPGGLMAKAGHAQTRFKDEISVRMPTREESTRLELPPGTPVAEHMRTGYNHDNEPVRVIVTIVPGDRHRIIYEVSGDQ